MAVMLALISGHFSNVASAQTSTEIEVQPIVVWNMDDGTTRVDRGGSWRLVTVDAASTLDSESSEEEIAKHRVIFMVDTSASMPQNHATAGGFETVVETVVDRARDVLEPFEGSHHIEVSLYRFDDLAERSGRWQPTVREVARSLDVREAMRRLPQLIPTQPEQYAGLQTYIAASVFEAVRRELELPDDPQSAIPDHAPPVTVLVFTDAGLGNGGENHDSTRPFDAAAYSQWMNSHVGRQQLHYVHWNIRTSEVEGLEPEQGVMHVRWAEPGRVDSWSTRSEVELRRQFELYSQLQLVPVLAAPEPSADAIVCPAREDANAPPVPRDPVLLEWQRPLEYNVGDLSGVDIGRHNIGLDQSTLCDGLTRAWPNVTFVLPSEHGEVSPVAWLEITDPDVHVLELVADGTVPDAPLSEHALEADRFHRWKSIEPRTYRLRAPEVPGLEVDVDWTIVVRRDNVPVDHARDLVRIRQGENDGLELTTESDQPVEVQVPGVRQRIIPFMRSVDQSPGVYSIELCAIPEVRQRPRPDSVMRLQCRDCAETAVRTDRICVLPEVELDDLPLSWWWIGLLAAILLLVLHAIIRLMVAPRFTRQTVGLPPTRIAELTRKDLFLYWRWLWKRRPYLLRFPVRQGDTRVQNGRHVGARLDTSQLTGTYVGVVPHRNGIKIWPVVVNRRVDVDAEDGKSAAPSPSWITIDREKRSIRLECAVDREGWPAKVKDRNSDVVSVEDLRNGILVSVHEEAESGQSKILQSIPFGSKGGGRIPRGRDGNPGGGSRRHRTNRARSESRR